MDLLILIIDDSELDNFIAKKIIEQSGKSLSVKTFKNAKPALETIREKSMATDNQYTIILLDLYMPLMNGFQFVEEFEKLAPEIQEKYTINILSSTRNQNDITRVLHHKKVSHFLEKPFTLDKLLSILPQ